MHTCRSVLKHQLCYFAMAVFLMAALAPLSRAAVGFTVTPSTVSNSYIGNITLQISGLTNTETVVVQKFLDINANGAIDGPDLLLQQFNLTDGKAGMVIGGVTNINVPGDLNGTTGAITAALNFQNGDFLQRIAGTYLYKLSSPVGHFTPITNPLTVTNLFFPQQITGNVVSNNTSRIVPNAVVVLFEPPRPGKSGPGTPRAGVIANNAGNYAVRLPAGTYQALLFRSNYVSGFAPPPRFTVAASQTLTTNISLTYAASSISGRVIDAANASIGLPGIWLFALGTNGQLAFTCADTNGNFNLRVTPGQWMVDTTYPTLSVHGYVGWDDSPNYVASAGATGVNLAYAKANALFYGSVRDNLGKPLPGAVVQSGDDDNVYYTDGYTDTNGNYVLGALGGLTNAPWGVQIESDASPTNYVYSYVSSSTNLSPGQTVRQDYTAILATNHISGTLSDDSGNRIPLVGIWANATIDGVFYHVYSVKTDANGHYTLNVPNGYFDVGGFVDLPSNYLYPQVQFVNVSNSNVVVDFTATLISVRIEASVPFIDENNQFGFTINGAPGITVVVEACTNLVNPIWSPLLTNTLDVSFFYFTDPGSTNYSRRFYRLRMP